MIDRSTGKCYSCKDYSYSTATDSCGPDRRQKQQAAFLLSFFLQGFGAANFYIQRYDLGLKQSSWKILMTNNLTISGNFVSL